MTATDELRAMLDERGVKWTAVGKDVTLDNQTYCYPHTFTEFQDGLVVTNLTPEQAIAATLGAGTCRVIKSELDGQMWVFRHEFSCACGQRNLFTSCSTPPRYCPNCGRKVEG